ncbi:LOW QUALITY PROTEIN: beta-carotene hydroxylase 2, chloroplastic-like [Curcuma longa]|uniref:LOW QUALITY PROTEIN: beta-carotene hydroxylase 2, chloroplastic-like n=1 Tax=Curcuma longa TaxID=136217 RepID=UPI003D9EFED5
MEGKEWGILVTGIELKSSRTQASSLHHTLAQSLFCAQASEVSRSPVSVQSLELPAGILLIRKPMAIAASISCRLPHGISGDGCLLVFRPLPLRVPCCAASLRRPFRRRSTAVRFVLKEVDREEGSNGGGYVKLGDALIKGREEAKETEELRIASDRRPEERKARKEAERRTYLIAAVMSSLGITSMAVAAVYYRFTWQMEGGEVPATEMFGTFALSVGAAVGMEFWARWAHRALWHASLWHMHESHHRPRDGPFELNDVFAIINAVPAISLMAYGFFNRGLLPGLCFGAGLGITLFGMAYMFVHDGLVHRRFPVGPIANVPYFRRVAAAHQIHHMDKFEGVPYGLFLGPKELEEVGGLEELEKEITRRNKLYSSSN